MMLSSDDAPALPLWINGHAFLTVVENFYDIVDPATGNTLRRTPLCAADACNEALGAAVGALPAWAATSPASRQAALTTVADNLARYSEHFAKLIGEESGKDAAAASSEVAAAVATLRQDFNLPNGTPTSEGRVLALLVDDSAPLLGAAALMAPALAGGNAFVIKPSPKAPSCALALAELLSRAGIPDGVGNLVHGDDAVINAIASHPQVALLAFAGNDSLAVKIAALTERNGKALFAAPAELAGNAWNARLHG
jgi:acyl-CoA reductase-like NAD-dependent aldehyde dehydrogenase